DRAGSRHRRAIRDAAARGGGERARRRDAADGRVDSRPEGARAHDDVRGALSEPLPVDETLSLVGLEEIAGQLTQQLSGARTQRVRSALSLVTTPDRLVLDEPTVAMDVESRHSFWTTMRELASRGKTIFFATHYLEEADDYADRAILMARGRIVADGPTTEIKAMVGTRTIRATLPGAELERLERP